MTMMTMTKNLAFGASLWLLGCAASPEAAPQEDAARRIHERVPLIDGHNDLPGKYRDEVDRRYSELDIADGQSQLMTDIARLREGGVGAQFWSVYVPAELQGEHAVRATMEQIDVVHEMVRRYPETFELAQTADDVERIFASGKIASMIGMEGGHFRSIARSRRSGCSTASARAT